MFNFDAKHHPKVVLIPPWADKLILKGVSPHKKYKLVTLGLNVRDKRLCNDCWQGLIVKKKKRGVFQSNPKACLHRLYRPLLTYLNAILYFPIVYVTIEIIYIVFLVTFL